MEELSAIQMQAVLPSGGAPSDASRDGGAIWSGVNTGCHNLGRRTAACPEQSEQRQRRHPDALSLLERDKKDLLGMTKLPCRRP